MEIQCFWYNALNFELERIKTVQTVRHPCGFWRRTLLEFYAKFHKEIENLQHNVSGKDEIQCWFIYSYQRAFISPTSRHIWHKLAWASVYLHPLRYRPAQHSTCSNPGFPLKTLVYRRGYHPGMCARASQHCGMHTSKPRCENRKHATQNRVDDAPESPLEVLNESRFHCTLDTWVVEQGLDPFLWQNVLGFCNCMIIWDHIRLNVLFCMICQAY